MHILLIEPDSLLARTYVQALLSAGHTVDHARSGQSAVILADEHMPDVVVLEMQLPTQNGIAFLQEFRSYPDWQAIPVLLHTYIAPQGNETICDIVTREYGVIGWLYKPQTSLAQLVSILHRHAVGEL
ncbi:MAG: response regulator [Candidatus Saccharibacteria bacterium]